MADIDRIIEELLGSRRISEGAAFSGHSYHDQPIIERGSDLRVRMEQRERERAARRQRDAQRRRQRARTKAPTPDKHERLDDWLLSRDFVQGRSDSSAFERSRRQEPQPERIREMRALERGGAVARLAYGSGSSAALFVQQAKLMADYEDDYEFYGGFSQYYPTYAAMTDHQLRGYFSWRSGVRAGHMEPAPLSFAFVYVYELLAGIGVEPGRAGFEALRAFGDAYRATDEANGAKLSGYLRRWLRDYAIYHEMPDLLATRPHDELGTSVIVLLRAEHALLRRHGLEPRIANEAARGDMPTEQQLFCALGATSTYHICEARLAKDEEALVTHVACDVFEALVAHCAKRRKSDYVEGVFGYATELPYTMFSAAIFSEETPHRDCEVRVSNLERYTCAGGRWRRLRACEASARSPELAVALHAVDRELREQLDYPFPLKERPVPKYLRKIVRDAVAARLAERAEAERRRVTIDFDKLGGIRAAAAMTQEALLTDEEREAPSAGVAAEGEPTRPTTEGAHAPATTPAASQPLEQPTPPPAATPPLEQPATAPQDVAHAPAATPADGTGATDVPFGLTALELRLLSGLLAGVPLTELLAPTDPFVSVVVDSINEKLFDTIGDAVIEFDGDVPQVIEDYLDDVRKVVQP